MEVRAERKTRKSPGPKKVLLLGSLLHATCGLLEQFPRILRALERPQPDIGQPGLTQPAGSSNTLRVGPFSQEQLQGLGTVTVPYSMADVSDLVIGPFGSSFRWDGHPVELRLVGP